MRRALQITGLAVIVMLLSGPALAGCATQIATPRASPSTSAAAEPSRPGTHHPTDYAIEEQLDQVVDDIERGEEEEDIPGLAGIELDPEAHTVDLYWVGEPPGHVRRTVADPPPGITVNLRPASYDVRDMLAAVDKVFTEYEDYLDGASPNAEGTGITVEWTAENAKKGPTAETMAEVAGMPVFTEVGEPAEPADG